MVGNLKVVDCGRVRKKEKTCEMNIRVTGDFMEGVQFLTEPKHCIYLCFYIKSRICLTTVAFSFATDLNSGVKVNTDGYIYI